MADLKNIRVAILVTDGFEESELVEPRKALQQAGATVDVIAPEAGSVQAFRHHDKGSQVEVDRTLKDVKPDEYDALMLPGGAFNADVLRMVEEAKSFTREMQNAGKPIAAICHAPWLLVSADMVSGRNLTSYYTLQDDIRNAGGTWTDEQTVLDNNLLTSRSPKDLKAFNSEMLKLFSKSQAGRALPRSSSAA